MITSVSGEIEANLPSLNMFVTEGGVDLEELTVMQKKDIENKAKVLLNQYPEYDGKSVDIVRLANSLGYTVGHMDLPDNTEGLIAIDDSTESPLQKIGTTRLIAVNPTINRDRQRFVIAHELGHIVLHPEKEGKPFYAKRMSIATEEDEKDADYFASALLLPCHPFCRAYEYAHSIFGNSKYEIVAFLSNHFLVDKDTISKRIEDLKELGFIK